MNSSKASSSWLPLVNMFKNREIEFGFSLHNIKTVFDHFTYILGGREIFPHRSIDVANN